MKDIYLKMKYHEMIKSNLFYESVIQYAKIGLIGKRATGKILEFYHA